MQRKFHSILKHKANPSAEGSYNGGTRFTCGTQFSRKSIGSAFHCALGNKTAPGKHSSEVKKKESFGDSGNRKARKTNGKASCGEGAVGDALEESDGSGEGKEKRNNRKDVKVKVSLLSLVDKKGWNKNVVTRFEQVRRKISLRQLIPSKIQVFGVKKKGKKESEEGDNDENEERELCKKRILMGKRCRVLSSPDIYSPWTNHP